MRGELLISCDEAGHTGPDLLHPEQRYFAFGSVSISDEEAWEIIQKVRRDHPVQMPELKASKLMRSPRGRSIVSDIVAAVDGRFAVNVYDKLLALCGWIFEYIYEPVYQHDPRLLYQKNLHRFVAMFSWLWFNETGGDADEAIRQFQKYMRSRDEADAPLLFGKIPGETNEFGSEYPFELVLRFARGYKDIIVADNANIESATPDNGRWVLDLSASALWSHLNHWGQSGDSLRVHCDVSKPLQAIVDHFTGDEADAGIRRARIMGYTDPLGWRLVDPVTFVDSRNHPAIQLADMIAGAAVTGLVTGIPEGFDGVMESIQRHMLRDTILPDFDIIDLKQRSSAVNYLVLYDLALRAERKADPYTNLAEMYHAAEVSWAQGDFQLHP